MKVSYSSRSSLRDMSTLPLLAIEEGIRKQAHRREADVALRLSRPTQPSLVVRKVAEVGSGLYASRAYLARQGWPKKGDLRGHHIIAYDETFQPQAEVAWYARHIRGARVVLRCNSARAFL